MVESSEFLKEVDNDQEQAENLIEGEPGKVKLYVESDADIPFWYAIFKRFAPALRIEFDFYALSITAKPEEPEDNTQKGEAEPRHTVCGKDFLLNQVRLNKNFVGSHRLICVDSDYDYLVPETDNAMTIRDNNPYILQTYTYSTENYKCLAESLDCICVDATCSADQEFDFVRFLGEYSGIVYDLFLYSVYSRKKNFKKTIECRGEVTLGDSLNIHGNASSTLEKLKEKVKQLIEDIDKRNPEIKTEISTLRSELEERGVAQKNAYLFIDGHKLFDGVVAPLLQQVVGKPKGEKHRQIRAKAKESATDRETTGKWHQSYSEMTLDTRALLNVNKAHFYQACPPLDMIKQDIEDYLARHPAGSTT
jgi:hypothetical protein